MNKIKFKNRKKYQLKLHDENHRSKTELIVTAVDYGSIHDVWEDIKAQQALWGKVLFVKDAAEQVLRKSKPKTAWQSFCERMARRGHT